MLIHLTLPVNVFTGVSPAEINWLSWKPALALLPFNCQVAFMKTFEMLLKLKYVKQVSISQSERKHS